MSNSLTTLLCLIPRQEAMTPLLDTSRWPEGHAADAEGSGCGERAGLAPDAVAKGLREKRSDGWSRSDHRGSGSGNGSRERALHGLEVAGWSGEEGGE
jgi:hypothetical protein